MNLRTAPWMGFGLSCVVVLTSCQSNPSTAFPTASTLAAHANGRPNLNIATLERGRKVYTTRCTECHVARTIANYSVEEWRRFIKIMAPRARLDPADRAALETYLMAARESMPQG